MIIQIQRGGYSRNPTVRIFKAAFKSICVQNLKKSPKYSNSETQIDTITLLATVNEWEDFVDN